MSQDEAKELVKEFWGFTTYFVGFFDNRKICIRQKRSQQVLLIV